MVYQRAAESQSDPLHQGHPGGEMRLSAMVKVRRQMLRSGEITSIPKSQNHECIYIYIWVNYNISLT